MFGKIFVSVIILAMSNFLLACSSVKNVDPFDLKEIPKTIITAVTLKTGETINFRGIAVKFDERKRSIIGVTDNDKVVRINTDNVLFINTKKSHAANAPERIMDYNSFKEYYKGGSREHIYGVVLKSGETIKFNKKGGTLSQSDMIIWGNIDEKTSGEYNFDEIQYIAVRRFSHKKMVIYTLIAIPVIIITAFAITASGENFAGG